jgi:hypothetical protein
MQWNIGHTVNIEHICDGKYVWLRINLHNQ